MFLAIGADWTHGELTHHEAARNTLFDNAVGKGGCLAKEGFACVELARSLRGKFGLNGNC